MQVKSLSIVWLIVSQLEEASQYLVSNSGCDSIWRWWGIIWAMINDMHVNMTIDPG